MTIPSPDAFKDKGTWDRWKKKNSPGMSPEEIIKSMEAAPHPFTNDPNNPFTILKENEKSEKRAKSDNQTRNRPRRSRKSQRVNKKDSSAN